MKNFAILSVLLLILISGCKREDPEFTGPSLDNLFGEFSVLEEFDITNRNVDFSQGETSTFTAVFSKEVDWEVHVTGLETGSKKIIQGFGSILDDASAKWNGSTTELPMFNIETCAVELRIPSDSLVVLDTLNIVGNQVINGLVVADFENGINPEWTNFFEEGGDFSFDITNDVVPGQGNNYYDMGGLVDWTWLVGLIDFPASSIGEDLYPLSQDPEKVYFNVMLYLPEEITNEVVLFQFKEDDNMDGVWTEGSEDMYSLELKNALEPGWQLISIKYSELPTLLEGTPVSPFGNGLYEANKLKTISCLLLSEPTSGYTQTFMDYIIFTENGPLQP